MLRICRGFLPSEVEVLQVDGAQRACEQVKVFLGEIHWAVQGALQAWREAGVPGEQSQVGERGRGGRGGGGGGGGVYGGGGGSEVPLLGERRVVVGVAEPQQAAIR